MVNVVFIHGIHSSVSFLTKLITAAGKRPLSLVDLGIPSQKDKAASLYDSYGREWEKEKATKKRKPSIMRTIIRATGSCYFWTAVLLNIVSVIMNFIPTYLLNLLVSDLEQESPSWSVCGA